MLKICPIESQPKKKPSCSSGCLKNSTTNGKNKKIFQGLVNLARMAKSFRILELDSPWHICYAAVKLAIYKIPKPAQSQAQGQRDDKNICQFIKINFSFFCKNYACSYRSQQAAVKAQAAVPYGKNFQWVCKVGFQIVNENIKNPGAQYHPDYFIKQKV